MLRYAITDSMRPGDDFNTHCETLRSYARRWAEAGLDYVQLREKSMDAGDLLIAANAMMEELRRHGAPTKFLINGRADVALASDAYGVHLTAHSDELTPEQVRKIFASVGARIPVVSVSCHNVADVERAQANRADVILFGPVFEKRVEGAVVVEGQGFDRLREAVVAADGTPVLALGGITETNTAECCAAGASGVAAIRLFRQP